MRLIRAIFWEALQNLPLVAGFVLALELWQQKQWGTALLCMAVASLLGALVIGFTESKIVEGHREPLRVVVANVVTMTGLMLIVVVYLSAGWSSWKTDLVVGTLAGAALAAVQDMAAGNPLGLGHAAALAGGLPLTLIGLRRIAFTWPPLAIILLIAGVLTGFIALVDYGSLT